MSRGLPWILVLLNGAPVTALVDTGAKLSIVSPDVVQKARLPEVDCNCPLLVMEEGAEVQPFNVVHAQIQYQEVILEHNFTVVESAKPTILLGNNFSQKAVFIVDQQMLRVYL